MHSRYPTTTVFHSARLPEDLASNKRAKRGSQTQLQSALLAGMSVSVLRDAYDFADALITEYKNEEKFFDRINYSFLKQRLVLGLISAEQKKEFDKLLKKYFMTGLEDKYKDCFDIRSKDEIFQSNSWTSGFYLFDAESFGTGDQFRSADDLV